MNRYNSTKTQRAKSFVNIKRTFAQTPTSVAYKDIGPLPLVEDIKSGAAGNTNWRTTLWTGAYLQMTYMSIPVGQEIPSEIHTDTDQMLYIVQGEAEVEFAGEKSPHHTAYNGYGIFIPAGAEHRIKNISSRELKLISVYAPPHHPRGSEKP